MTTFVVYLIGGTTQNFSTPIYFVACSLNATNHTIPLDSNGLPLGSGKQPVDVTWSTFSPAGDLNLTSAVSLFIPLDGNNNELIEF